MKSTITNYIEQIERELRAGKTTESTFRPAFKSFIESLQPGITAVNEPGHFTCGAPDFRVVNEHQLGIGYVETKDLGESLELVINGEQLRRYRSSLENLILTNYLDFKWLVRGEERKYVSIGTIDDHKHIKKRSDSINDVYELITDFLNYSPEPVGRADELAKLMARLARGIRDVLFATYQKQQLSEEIETLFDTLRNDLIHNLIL